MCPSSTTSSERTRPGAAADGLIAVEPDVPTDPGAHPAGRPGGRPGERAWRRAVPALVLVLFALATAGSGLVDALLPVDSPEPIGIERARDERLRADAAFLDGSLARVAEQDWKLRSRVRAAVVPPWALFLYAWLGEVKDFAVAGEEGWLFLRSRVETRDEPDDALVGLGAARLAALVRRVAARGPRTVVLPVPRKAVVCGEYLPPSYDARPELDAALPAALRARGVEAVDLLAVFRERAEGRLYQVLDTHWTQHAELLAAEAVCREAGLLVPEAERRTRVESAGAIPEDLELLRSVGVEPTERVRARFAGLVQDDLVLTLADGPRVPLLLPTGGSRIALVGTSFSARRKLAYFMGHFAQEPVQNRAVPAEGPIAPLRDFLRTLDPARSPVELIVLELPNNYVLGRNPLEPLDELWWELAPRAPAVVAGTDHVFLKRGLRTPRRIGGVPRDAVSVRPGAVAHTGDGVLGLRLRGSFRGALEVAVDCGSGSVRALWPDAVPEVVVPCVGSTVSSTLAATVRAAPGTPPCEDVRLDAAELVSDLDPASAAEAELEPVRGAGGGWSQLARLPADLDAPAGAVLELALDVRGGFEGALRVVGLDAAGAERELAAFEGLRRDARVFVTLPADALPALAAARVEGHGRVPTRGLARAAVASPARP